MVAEVWSFLETQGEELADTAGKMATEAKRTAGIFKIDACGIICGKASPGAMAKLQCYGLKKLYIYRNILQHTPETIARVISSAAMETSPDFILFADTPLGAELAGRAAVLLRNGLITNCIDFEFGKEGALARKISYGGKVHAVLTWKTPPPRLATMAVTTLEEVQASNTAAPEIIYQDVPQQQEVRTKLVNTWDIDLTKLDISEARVVIGVGGAVTSDFMEAVKKLAASLKGIVAGSRIAVYNGLIPLERQIGTTGKWLNSEVYITLGISGAPQHVMGIKEVKNLIAINIAKQAPIIKYAKLGIIGDLYKVVPKLLELIESGTGK